SSSRDVEREREPPGAGQTLFTVDLGAMDREEEAEAIARIQRELERAGGQVAIDQLTAVQEEAAPILARTGERGDERPRMLQYEIVQLTNGQQMMVPVSGDGPRDDDAEPSDNRDQPRRPVPSPDRPVREPRPARPLTRAAPP